MSYRHTIGPADALIGRRIREARGLRRMSRADLAARLGCQEDKVESWEHGTHRLCPFLLSRIAYILGQDLCWFFELPLG